MVQRDGHYQVGYSYIYIHIYSFGQLLKRIVDPSNNVWDSREWIVTERGGWLNPPEYLDISSTDVHINKEWRYCPPAN
jgi:hypothetical protein